jgi:hypothetical protein
LDIDLIAVTAVVAPLRLSHTSSCKSQTLHTFNIENINKTTKLNGKILSQNNKYELKFWLLFINNWNMYQQFPGVL